MVRLLGCSDDAALVAGRASIYAWCCGSKLYRNVPQDTSSWVCSLLLMVDWVGPMFVRLLSLAGWNQRCPAVGQS
jgi:hypothetical protein